LATDPPIKPTPIMVRWWINLMLNQDS